MPLPLLRRYRIANRMTIRCTPRLAPIRALAQRGAWNLLKLALSSVATPFSVNTAGNEELGQVRTSGIHPNEKASAGTLQQVDLDVQPLSMASPWARASFFERGLVFLQTVPR